MISAALVSILLGLAASNMGIIPHETRAYSVVMEFLLPLTIPLMLFRADMRSVIKSTGKLLLAFLIGSVATMIGTLVAYLIVPMRSLGQDSWKIASALMASYIGGAINYVAVSDALAVSPSVIAAGVAADNVICAIYFMALFALGSKLPAEASPSTKGPANNLDSASGDNAPVLQTATALAVSFAICKGATHVVRLLKYQGGTLPAITAVVVILATLLPRQIGYLAPAGDMISAISIQVFFAVLGASGSIWNVINVAPSIFVFAFIQVTVHLFVVLGLGKLLLLDLKLLLLASNANIGGPTTASGMATAKGWGSLVVPGWLSMWIMLPTKTYKETWTLALSKHLKSTYFHEQGTNLVLFSFPIMFLASFGCIYLHFQTMSTPKSSVIKKRLDILKRPLFVMNPLGIVTATEFMFSAMLVMLLGWSLGNYLYVSFGHLHMDMGVQMWQSKFRSVSLRLGYIGNMTWAFLFFPVTRGSSLLRLVGLTSESSVKYHIWLGHLSMVLFTAHGVGFFIYWGITHQMVLALQWSQTYLSNVAGEIAFVIASIMWVTSISRVRRKMFELFFYTHQTYMLYIFFYIIHVGVAYFCLILPGIFLFLIDRYLRFLQSRTNVTLIAARLLPCDTLELNFSKIAGLEYTPSSILFVNVPLISKMQWHPFTVTSNANMDPDTLSIVIKCQGTWSHKLYQQLYSSPIDRLQVSVEGPYGPASPHFLRYENLVLISGGSGITPFISIIRELSFQMARQQQQQPNKNQTIPASVLLICAFKNSADLSMLDLLLPLTSNSTPPDLSQINFQIRAYITREKEQQQPLENTKKPLQTIWFKPNTSDSPISTPLGPNSWLWLCVIITSSFIMFLVFLGILIRYHIYPVELARGPSAYNYTFKTLWDMFFVCASVFLATSFVFLWQKKDNDKRDATKVQNLELSEVGEIESFTHQSVREITNVHFGGRPDLKTMLLENNKKGSAVGVMACGPRKMRHEVAKICASNLASNLHLESMSFNW